MGFCPDFTPDKTVGVATERLLVGSQDVAHDCAKLKELGVTHILNVAYGVPNAFTDVSIPRLIESSMPCIKTKCIHNYYRAPYKHTGKKKRQSKHLHTTPKIFDRPIKSFGDI